MRKKFIKGGETVTEIPPVVEKDLNINFEELILDLNERLLINKANGESENPKKKQTSDGFERINRNEKLNPQAEKIIDKENKKRKVLILFFFF